MKRLFLQIFAWLAILLGVGLMLQPTVSQYLAARQSTKTVQKFVQAAEAAAPAVAETTDNAEPARATPNCTMPCKPTMRRFLPRDKAA